MALHQLTRSQALLLRLARTKHQRLVEQATTELAEAETAIARELGVEPGPACEWMTDSNTGAVYLSDGVPAPEPAPAFDPNGVNPEMAVVAG